MNEGVQRFHRVVFIIAAIFHIVTAWFSTGYHSEDEHHQVIGFAETWSGELSSGEQAWEYHARIRPSALPWIAVGMFKVAHAFGIDDPFTKAFVLRLLTAVLALFAVRGFVNAMRAQLAADLWKPFVIVAYWLWFLPFLHVRFSSETWSGLFMLMGLTAALKDDHGRWWAIRAGALLAVAIWIRPPVAVVVISLFLWMWLVRKDAQRDLYRFAGAAALSILLATAIDTLFYGAWTMSLWRYVVIGVNGDPDHVFDMLPWYYYMPWVVKYAIPPIGLCMLFALLVLVLKRPQHVLVWCTLPFMFLHSILPHKEMRFFYPLADLVPLLLLIGYQELRPFLEGASLKSVTGKWMLRACLAVLLICNVPGLAVVCSNPAGNGRVDLARVIRDRSAAKPVSVAYLCDPQFAWRICLPHFYRPDGSADATIAVGDTTVHSIQADLLIAHTTDVQVLKDQREQRLEKIVRAEPGWTAPLLRLYSWGECPEPWTLYAVE